jgi:hypothetical protein
LRDFVAVPLRDALDLVALVLFFALEAFLALDFFATGFFAADFLAPDFLLLV